MTLRLLTGTDIIDFYAARRQGIRYLAVQDGDFVHLGEDDIADGTPLSYNLITTTEGAEARILMTQDAIADGEWFPDALGEDDRLKPDVAEEMAAIVNQDGALVRDIAIGRAREATTRAELAADVAAAFATARAAAIADVVSMCGGNQSEAARLLGIDQSRVNRLVGKIGRMAEPISSMGAAMELANRNLTELATQLSKSA